MQWDNVAPHTAVKPILSLLFFAVKTGFFVFLYMWIRWTLPRFRYDQLMALGWKLMLPLALSYIMVLATVVLVLESSGIRLGSMGFNLVLFAMNLVLVFVLFGWLDRGRIISPAYSRLERRDLAKLQRIAPDRGAVIPE